MNCRRLSLPSLLGLLTLTAIIGGKLALLHMSPLSLNHIDHERTPEGGVEIAMHHQDIVSASLLLAQKYYPDIDRVQTDTVLDGISDRIRMHIAEGMQARQVVEIINKHIFEHLQPTGNVSESSLLPDRVLQNKKGHCLGLSLIYIALAQRLKLDIFARVVPNHVFLCYDDGVERFNIEMTSRGVSPPDAHYLSYLPYPDKPPGSVYFRRLSESELLGVFLTNVGSCLGRNRAGLDAHRKAAKLFPKSAEIQVNIGAVYLVLGQTRKAGAHLRRAQEMNPGLWQAHTNLGDLYYETANYEEGVNSYLKAVDLLHRSFTIHAYVIGLPRGAEPLELAKECLGRADTSVEQLFGFAIIAFRRGEYGLSERLFRRALQLSPEDPHINSFQAVLSFRMGDYSQAIKYGRIANGRFGYAPALGPMFLIHKLAHCYNQLGKSYGMMGQHELALRALDEGIKVCGPRVALYASLGATYSLKGDKRRAIRSYERALALDPSDDSAGKKLSTLRNQR